ASARRRRPPKRRGSRGPPRPRWGAPRRPPRGAAGAVPRPAGGRRRPAPAPRAPGGVPPAAGVRTAPAATATPASETVRSMAVATGARPDPVIAKVVAADERRRMIAEAAYHKFLQRGPGNGSPAQDWIEAEAEIDALLAEQHIVRAQ